MRKAAFLLVLALLLAGCGGRQTPGVIPTATPAPTATPTLPPTAGLWQESVDAVAALTRGLPIPDHLLTEEAARTGGEFDANALFDALDHLSMQEGYVLDYVYCHDGIGGSPRLYAWRTDQPRLEACDEVPDKEGHLRHVRTDGSEEGFFQLVLLKVSGEQFYLFWHAALNDDRVLCDRDGMERVLVGRRWPGRPMTPDQQAAARRIDLTPKVEMGEKKVAVEIVTFTKWGGFFKERHEVNREYPHAPFVSSKEVLVEYNCGVMF